jgi:cobalt-zinc-cadmium efflux system membrane fusion protein
MANGERSRDVAARYPGIVRRVLVKPGDSVKEGAVLAVVQSNESLQDYPLKAPIAGVVTARNTNPGEQTADRGLFMVTDLSTVWVELAVFPRDVAKVHVGQKARVRSADGGITAEGAVIYVAPVGNQASQARTVRVLLDNASGQWAPGLYVTADIALAETDVPVAIRNQAVQTLEGKDTVFVRTTKGFQPRPVHLGRRDATHSEVLEGLRPGETYATENSFILKAELGKGEAEHED